MTELGITFSQSFQTREKIPSCNEHMSWQSELVISVSQLDLSLL